MIEIQKAVKETKTTTQNWKENKENCIVDVEVIQERSHQQRHKLANRVGVGEKGMHVRLVEVRR